MKETKPSRAALRLLPGRVLVFLGVTLLCLCLILLGLIWVLERGPSPTVTGMFCRSVRETSAIRWTSEIFLSAEELEQYKSVSTLDLDTRPINANLIHVTAAGEAEIDETRPPCELIDISEGTCRGKLLIVYDPRAVILGCSEDFGHQPGMQLVDLVDKYGGIAGINASGFNDENGRGDGGTPQGLVISDGALIWGDADKKYNVVGLDRDGILRVGAMTGQQALDEGLRWAVSFVTHDGLASTLIVNGEIQEQNLGGGVNPRTAIGQRGEDGALLLLVLDGRSISTLGATMRDICNIMLEYGAVNVGNLDGGSSSLMVFGGEIVNNCSSVVGPRRIPTAFIVMEERYE